MTQSNAVPAVSRPSFPSEEYNEKLIQSDTALLASLTIWIRKWFTFKSVEFDRD